MRFLFDPTYILVIIGMAFAGYAQWKVTSTFRKYSDWDTENGTTGRQAAQTILQQTLIHDVTVEHVSGDLTDHYDSRHKVLRLSDATDQERSIAAVAVAAHECGHAVQDAESYFPLRLRNALVPVTQFGSAAAMPIIIAGFLFQWMGLVQFGIILFGLVLLFQVVTLPVEFDASARALRILEQNQLLTADELPAARKVLNAAALTYVAAASATALQLLRLIILSSGRDND